MFSFSGDAKTAGDWPLRLQGQYVSLRLDPWARQFLNDKQVAPSRRMVPCVIRRNFKCRVRSRFWRSVSPL
jgi:hypothetical protein